MRFDILTLFPGFFESPLNQTILKKAIEKGILDVHIHNIRDYAQDRHRVTDDYPYGGGDGMVMKVEPIVRCVEDVKAMAPDSQVILTTPQGKPFTQSLAGELSGLKGLIIICGRYEGVDERVRELVVDMEISIGDYILGGGELPALVILDTVSRLIPGVLGCEVSAMRDSFSQGLLEYPQYTRPEVFRGLRVPSVLLSGNHKEIEGWRRRESIKRTLERRPDLLEKTGLMEEDKKEIERLKPKV